MIFYSEIYHSEAIPQELFRQMRVQCLIRGGGTGSGDTANIFNMQP